MLKAGQLPAPVIKPLKYDAVGTKIKVDTNTYIQIKSNVPGVRLYFTTDGTKPDPFQTGRTGKASTHKYIGPFRLQLGSRVLKAIAVSRDRLRESPVTTKYIDVLPESVDEPERWWPESAKRSNHYSSSESTDDDEEPSEFISRGGVLVPYKSKQSSKDDVVEVQGALEGGPSNPVNYSGTQINVWGLPTPGLANLFGGRQPPQPNIGPHTQDMINHLNTPRESNDLGVLPENLKKFFKQLKRIYERDSDFQGHLDYLMENGQVKSASITEDYDHFNVSVDCPKFVVDRPKEPKKPPAPRPKPRPVSPPIQIIDTKPTSSKDDVPPPPPPPPPKKEEDEKQKTPIPPPPPAKKDPPPLAPDEPSIYKEELMQQGTVVDAPNFKPESDCEALRKAMKGVGTKEDVLIKILGNRSLAQRLTIKNTYKGMYGRDLIEDIKGETSMNFKKLLIDIMTPAVEFDCVEMRKAIQGIGTDNKVLVELLTTRSNNRLKEMSRLYYELFKKKMESDITGDTSGAFRKLLVGLLEMNRPESSEVDMNQVKKDTDEIIKAGPSRWSQEDSEFQKIFCTRSFAHLRRLFEEYEKQTARSIEEPIKKDMSGNLSKTYLALVANIRNRPGYFASEIKKSIKGLGTDEHTLNRIVVSRSEVDMIQIKQEFAKQNKNSMEKDIKDDVSGDYGKLLLLLIQDPSERTYDVGGSAEPDEPQVIETVEETPVEETPVITDAPGFDAAKDCERLRKAMKGLGTDEKTIIEILCHRSNKQRQELKNKFQGIIGRDLMKDLHSELSGSFRDLVELMMMPTDEFDAENYRKALKGLGTDENCLIELLTTRTPDQINQAKAKYQSMFNRSLEADIISDTSGHFKKALVSLLTAIRPATGNTVNRTQAKKDAEELYKLGVKQWGTDESKFITVLCMRSYPQLRATFEAYEQASGGHKIEDDIKKELSGDTQKTFLAIVASVRDKQAFFAESLYKSMKGWGTKEQTLIRIAVSRSEVDLVQIKKKFAQAYNKELADMIKGDTSGDFRKCILALIGNGE